MTDRSTATINVYREVGTYFLRYVSGQIYSAPIAILRPSCRDVDRTPRGRVSQNDTGQRQESTCTSMILPTLGSRTAKERNRTCRVEVIRLLRNAGVCLRGCSRAVFGACIMSFSIISLVALGRYRGKESVPIELAQCWFLAWAGHFQRLIYIFSNKIYGNSFIKHLSETVIINKVDCSLKK